MIPERTAAIPSFVPAQFEDAAPGHRFQMYFVHWEAGCFTAYKDARLPDIKHLDKRERDRIRKQFDAEKKASLDEVCPLGKSAKAMLAGLRQRQQALIATYGADGLHIPATSTAPFATGLGNEHPIENGFAFLNPYGLPYLAGSGVKGVLRRAAEELALFPEEYDIAAEAAPALLDVWWLFGFEGAAGAVWERDTHHGRAFEAALPALAARDDLRTFIATLVTDEKIRAYFLDSGEGRRSAFLTRLLEDQAFRQSLAYRGALDCWDVFPAPAGDRLVVEIMTPHHAGYYMDGHPPHDAESPIPIPFLAVPARSAFDFHVVCAGSRLPEPLRTTWQPMLRRIFKHAFDWLGFGAKTSVGYGAMDGKEAPAIAQDRPTGKSTSTASARQTAPAAASEAVWPAAKLTFNPSTGEIKAAFEGKTTAGLKGGGADALRAALGERANKLKKDKELRNVAVRVSQQGNLFVLLGLG